MRFPSVIPLPIKSCAYPTKRLYHETNQITVSSAKVVGCVVIIYRLKRLVPNSRDSNIPVGCPNLFRCPKISVPEKSFITSGSSAQSNALGSIPNKSCNLQIIVGSSCPRISSFNTFSSISWKLKLSRLPGSRYIISRILNRCEILDIHIIWNNSTIHPGADLCFA